MVEWINITKLVKQVDEFIFKDPSLITSNVNNSKFETLEHLLFREGARKLYNISNRSKIVELKKYVLDDGAYVPYDSNELRTYNNSILKVGYGFSYPIRCWINKIYIVNMEEALIKEEIPNYYGDINRISIYRCYDVCFSLEKILQTSFKHNYLMFAPFPKHPIFINSKSRLCLETPNPRYKIYVDITPVPSRPQSRIPAVMYFTLYGSDIYTNFGWEDGDVFNSNYGILVYFEKGLDNLISLDVHASHQILYCEGTVIKSYKAEDYKFILPDGSVIYIFNNKTKNVKKNITRREEFYNLFSFDKSHITDSDSKYSYFDVRLKCKTIHKPTIKKIGRSFTTPFPGHSL